MLDPDRLERIDRPDRLERTNWTGPTGPDQLERTTWAGLTGPDRLTSNLKHQPNGGQLRPGPDQLDQTHRTGPTGPGPDQPIRTDQDPTDRTGPGFTPSLHCTLSFLSLPQFSNFLSPVTHSLMLTT